MNKAGERLYNGLVKENPTFVLMLGMCPTLAVTTSAVNGLGMGLTTMVVLALSNLFISLLRKVIPNRVRIPAFIVVIASFVTVVQLLLEAYLPALNKSLGVYIPLIVVNCIILGRAESYAYSNPPVPSLFDGIGMGLGFSFALTCIGVFRELLGAGKIFGIALMPEGFEPVRIFSQAPGAFFVLAMLVALQNYIKGRRKKEGKPYEKIGSGCSEDCMNCSDQGCTKRFYDDGAGKRGTPKPVAKRMDGTAGKKAVQPVQRRTDNTAREKAQRTDSAAKEKEEPIQRRTDSTRKGKTAKPVHRQPEPTDGFEYIDLVEEEK